MDVKEKEKKMETRYENLEHCANYLVQLFYKTDKRYSCSRTKIGKLLSILAFKYATKDIKLFFEPIYRYDGCGTAIAHINYYLPRDVYRMLEYDNSKRRIRKSELKEDVDIPAWYQDISSLFPTIKEDIEDVFFTFGAYSQVHLSEELNPIVEYERMCDDDGRINLAHILAVYGKLPGNKVVEYIFKW